MSFDHFSDPDRRIDYGDPAPAAESPDDPTRELAATATTLEGEYGPVSFIRESWLRPPGAPSQSGDTDPLTVIYSDNSLNLPGWARRAAVAVAGGVVALILCLGYLAAHNANVASKWQQRAVAQAALTQKVSDQLKQANDHITTLDGTVGSLQGQLTKAKANSSLGGTLKRLLWPFG